MDNISRKARIDIARNRAAEVTSLLKEHNLTFGHAVSFASEIFQILAVMGEANQALVKGLVALTLQIQGTDIDSYPMREYGILNINQLPPASNGPSEEASGDKR